MNDDYRTILPFTHDGKQIPALHDLVRNGHKLAWMNLPNLFFKPIKVKLPLKKKYPKWLAAFVSLNNNGEGSRAWKYLQQGTSGVFAQGDGSLQPCVFATADFARNVVHVLYTFYYKGTEWAEIEALDCRKAPPSMSQVIQRVELMAVGLAHKFVSIGINGKLYAAPKDAGEVWTYIVSDGTKLYIETSKLMKIEGGDD